MDHINVLTTAKNAVRSAMRATLRTITADVLASQSAAAGRVASLQPWFTSASTISVFLSMPAGEVQTRSLLAAAFESGKDVFVPVAGARREDMPLVHITRDDSVDTFPVDRWNIPIPPPNYAGSSPDATRPRKSIRPAEAGATALGDAPLDVVFVPGLAFSPLGARLGHGKGHYGEEESIKRCACSCSSRLPVPPHPDTFLSALFTRYDELRWPRPLCVGLCLDCQLLVDNAGLSLQPVPTGPLDIVMDAVVTPTLVYDSRLLRAQAGEGARTG